MNIIKRVVNGVLTFPEISVHDNPLMYAQQAEEIALLDKGTVYICASGGRFSVEIAFERAICECYTQADALVIAKFFIMKQQMPAACLELQQSIDRTMRLARADT